MPDFSFGGDWSRIKLEIVQKYLRAYTVIMSRHKEFHSTYIDAFAGTGYQNFTVEENPNVSLFPDLASAESSNREGSARLALSVEPRFNQYIFIEKNRRRFKELRKVLDEYPEIDIKVRNIDANDYLIRICREGKWKKYRAVVFLDPFGMQVKWETITAIASTRAIDLWYLFPAGIAVNRLLKTDGSIPVAWRLKLDETLGENNWENVFYHNSVEQTFYGEEVRTKKVGDFAAITDYFVNRLRTIFPYVAHNPYPILNKKSKTPMYVLCFASANKTAVKIAEDILRKY